MSIIVQAWVYKNSESRLADRLVLLAIADEADDDGFNAYPSQRRIAEKARLGQSTVRRSIEELERAGELVVDRPEKTGRGKFNRYVVLMGRTAEAAQSEHLSDQETRRNAPLSGADPQTRRSIHSKGAQSEHLPGPVRTALSRGADAQPLWETDENGDARWIGPGPAPMPANKTWS